MKKSTALIVFSLFFLCSCAPDAGQSGSGSQTELPASSTPEMSTGSIEVLTPYADVRGIDEVNTLQSGEYVPEDMYTYWFNQNTLFEGNEALAAEIMETGKNPGLHVQELHDRGITGKNVTVAIIDQPLLPGHPEYAGKIEEYYTVGLTEKDSPSSMHGPAVTSLLAGNSIGTAPDVRLYYAAIKFWDRNASEMAGKALDWLIEQNKTLPESERIRAVSVSADLTNTEYFDHPEVWDEAVKRAREAGILVLDCRADYDTCVFWPSFFDFDQRDDITASKIGTPDGDFLECPAQALGWQVNPSLTGQELLDLMRQTAYENDSGNRFLDPAAFIDAVHSTVHENQQ